MSINNIYGVNYFINFFIKNVYLLFNNINVNSKHIEVILKQLLSINIINIYLNNNIYYVIKSRYYLYYYFINKSIINNVYFNKYGFSNIIFRNLVFGISKSSMFINSFLSVASFKDTLNILFKSSIYCYVDTLYSIVSNLIFGTIPLLGTGIFVNNVNY